MFPTVYNANMRIVQGPGAVAITYEMIHDTRVIPIEPRPTSERPFAGTTAMRAAAGRATRSSSTLPTSARRRTTAAHARRCTSSSASRATATASTTRSRWTIRRGRSRGRRRSPWPTAGRRAVRVRVPRGEQLDAEYPERIAGRGEGEVTRAACRAVLPDRTRMAGHALAPALHGVRSARSSNSRPPPCR